MVDHDTAPTIQTIDITDHTGNVLRPARVATAEWRDPEDTNPLRRQARTIQGHRVVSPLLNLHARSPREITADHIKAAKRLMDDWEVSEGARAGAVMARVDHAGHGDGPTIMQLDALKRFREARAALKSCAQFVLPVVLLGWPLERVAAAATMDRQRVHGRLAAGLDLLYLHYWPDQEVATIMPAALLVDAAVTDLPQERLGRRG